MKGFRNQEGNNKLVLEETGLHIAVKTERTQEPPWAVRMLHMVVSQNRGTPI